MSTLPRGADVEPATVLCDQHCFALAQRADNRTSQSEHSGLIGRAVTDDERSAALRQRHRHTRSWKVAISFTGLSQGTHRITVRPLARKNASSSSTNVVVAFVVRS